MVTHLVLLRPRQNLAPDERRALVDALKKAFRDIPTIRRARVGVRVKLGIAYEQQFGLEDLTIAAILEFDDLAGVQAYLAHPAHQQLGAQFRSAADVAMVYDYEMGEVGELEALLKKTGI
ncbi:MAG TPA: Dabb family protein [Vicinamibacterales bacterium]|jgi:hypothetical protein